MDEMFTFITAIFLCFHAIVESEMRLVAQNVPKTYHHHHHHVCLATTHFLFLWKEEEEEDKVPFHCAWRQFLLFFFGGTMILFLFADARSMLLIG